MIPAWIIKKIKEEEDKKRQADEDARPRLYIEEEPPKEKENVRVPSEEGGSGRGYIEFDI